MPKVVVFSDLPTLEMALDVVLQDEQPHCIGRSAFGSCQVAPRFAVSIGTVTRHTCGRHLSWLVGRILTPGRSLTVTDITARSAHKPQFLRADPVESARPPGADD